MLPHTRTHTHIHILALTFYCFLSLSPSLLFFLCVYMCAILKPIMIIYRQIAKNGETERIWESITCCSFWSVRVFVCPSLTAASLSHPLSWLCIIIYNLCTHIHWWFLFIFCPFVSCILVWSHFRSSSSSSGLVAKIFIYIISLGRRLSGKNKQTFRFILLLLVETMFAPSYSTNPLLFRSSNNYHKARSSTVHCMMVIFTFYLLRISFFYFRNYISTGETEGYRINYLSKRDGCLQTKIFVFQLQLVCSSS